MAALEKIRVKFGLLITVLIAVALLSFIIDPNTLTSAMSVFSSKNDVGEIAGKSVNIRDYQEKVDYYTTIHQLTTGNAASTEDEQQEIYTTAWASFVEDMLYKPTFKKAGIGISDEEIYNLSQGTNISPVLAQSPMFYGPDGQFSREAVATFVQSIDDDPTGNQALVWNFLEDRMISGRLSEKYESLIANSNVLNSVELRRALEENNQSSDVDFVMIPHNYSNDSSIVVSDSEIKSFYDARKDMFKQLDSRDIEYVVFSVNPSQEDIDKERAEIEVAYETLKQDDINYKTFLSRNSDLPYNTYYYKEGELTSVGLPEFDEEIFKNKSTITPIINKDERFVAAKVIDKKNMPDSVYVAHILLAGPGSEEKADSLLNLLKRGESFEALAAEHSLDNNPNTPARGDIGWFTQSYIIPGFEGVFDMPLKKYELIKTQYGTHIVTVKERTKTYNKVQLAMLAKAVEPSKKTFQDVYNQASEFMSQATGSYENYIEAVNQGALVTSPAMRIPEGERKIGNFNNALELTRWAYEAKEGEVSHIITLDNDQYVVAVLTDIHKEGYTPIEDIEDNIRQTLVAEKIAKQEVESIAAKIEGATTIEEVAEKLGTTVSHKDGVTFGAINVQRLDPKFIGAVAAAEVGKLVGPVEGNIGTYVLVVKDRQLGAFYTEKDAENRNAQVTQGQLSTLGQILLNDAEVKDYRGKFY